LSLWLADRKGIWPEKDLYNKLSDYAETEYACEGVSGVDSAL